MRNKIISFVFIFFVVFSCKNNKEVSPIVQDVQELVFASGQLEWDDAYNLMAQTDGILTNANFDVGDKVKKGTLIAVVNNSTNENNTQSAQEQLKIANENLTSNSPALQQLQQNIQYAESKYKQDKLQAERYERLFNNQSIAKVEYENISLIAKNSLSQLNSLKQQYQQIIQQAKQQQISTQNQLKNSQVNESYNQVVSTEAGTIIKKLKSNGDYVKKGDIIATIADDNKVEAVLNVDENSISKIKIGQEAFIKLNTDKNKIYKGKVSEILTAFDEKTQSFICKVYFGKMLNKYLFGTQLEANILVGAKKNALLIPRNYVGFGNKVNIKGKDENTIIKTGIVSTDYVEILSGVSKNDILLPLKP